MTAEHEHGDLAALFATMTPEEQTAIIGELPPQIVEAILEALPPVPEPEPTPTAPRGEAWAFLRTLHPDDLAWAVSEPEAER